jgi:hypothetical protein
LRKLRFTVGQGIFQGKGGAPGHKGQFVSQHFQQAQQLARAKFSNAACFKSCERGLPHANEPRQLGLGEAAIFAQAHDGLAEVWKGIHKLLYLLYTI